MATEPVAAVERFEFWRELNLFDFGPDATNEAQRRDFRASSDSIVNGRGLLSVWESDPISGGAPHKTASNAGGSPLLGLLIAGERIGEARGDQQTVTRPGEFFAFDPDRASRVVLPGRTAATHVSLPRAELAARFGGEAPSPATLVKALGASRLAPIVAAQMRLAARQLKFLTDGESDALMNATVDLILSAVSTGAREDMTLAPAGLYTAALRYIEQRLGDTTLDVDGIARALGCSRASLYRLFADRHAGVAETIRAMRMERLRGLLQNEQASIADAAERCGLTEPRTVQRLFRDRFGLSPRDFRAMSFDR